MDHNKPITYLEMDERFFMLLDCVVRHFETIEYFSHTETQAFREPEHWYRTEYQACNYIFTVKSNSELIWNDVFSVPNTEKRTKSAWKFLRLNISQN